jgi:hypothetical protein
MPAFEAGLARADQVRQLRRAEVNLSAALAAGRATSLAVGLRMGLRMGRFQADRNTAFEVLRDHARAGARSTRWPTSCGGGGEEVLNSLHAAFASRLKSKIARRKIDPGRNSGSLAVQL